MPIKKGNDHFFKDIWFVTAYQDILENSNTGIIGNSIFIYLCPG